MGMGSLSGAVALASEAARQARKIVRLVPNVPRHAKSHGAVQADSSLGGARRHPASRSPMLCVCIRHKQVSAVLARRLGRQADHNGFAPPDARSVARARRMRWCRRWSRRRGCTSQAQACRKYDADRSWLMSDHARALRGKVGSESTQAVPQLQSRSCMASVLLRA